MRKSILEAANHVGTYPDTKVVLAGMANVYTHYITTFEEYQVQVSQQKHVYPKHYDIKLFRDMKEGQPSTVHTPWLLIRSSIRDLQSSC